MMLVVQSVATPLGCDGARARARRLLWQGETPSSVAAISRLLRGGRIAEDGDDSDAIDLRWFLVLSGGESAFLSLFGRAAGW